VRTMDLAKLKVVELRAMLSERGLDAKGNKPVLVERLRKALEEEEEIQERKLRSCQSMPSILIFYVIPNCQMICTDIIPENNLPNYYDNPYRSTIDNNTKYS